MTAPDWDGDMEATVPSYRSPGWWDDVNHHLRPAPAEAATSGRRKRISKKPAPGQSSFFTTTDEAPSDGKYDDNRR